MCLKFKDVDAQDAILQEIVFGFWRIWKCRNDMVFNEVMIHPLDALKFWSASLGEFRAAEREKNQEAKPGGDGGMQKMDRTKVAWVKPSFGKLT